MKEKLRYIFTSSFAKVAAWIIFGFCALCMAIGKLGKKKKIEEK